MAPTPSTKHASIDAIITAVMGKSRIETIEQGGCMTCDAQPPVVLRDALSEREYTISGMCQACQDSVFGCSR